MNTNFIVLLVLLSLYLIDAIKLRARDLGIPFDGVPGKYNAITDVDGVQVGFRTIIEGNSIRTGVTAIFPRGAHRPVTEQRCFANWYSLNGNGEMTGMHPLTESGFLSTPIVISNTNSIGICHQAILKWMFQKELVTTADIVDIGLPVIAETWDGYLNDYREFPIKEEHVFDALNNAKDSGPIVQEGNVGGGTGMITFGFKAGTGTSSRIVGGGLNYTVGVLVQSNFGRKHQLIIAGIPVGQEILKMKSNTSSVPDKDVGSIIVIVATDAPLLSHQLKRLATRVSLGIGKVGGIGADSSGDIFLAFSTANISDISSTTKAAEFLSNDLINPLFDATIQCVEEAIINSMVAAETMVGFGGIRVEAISHNNIIQILKKYNRLTNNNIE